MLDKPRFNLFINALMFLALLAVLLIYFPFLVTPEVLELGRGGGRLRP
jgi:hypothetical protein